ncbi:Mu transposase domain-containing protein [Dorea sp.]|uniref:Mu transposase domain-containing protein n=1 Tax=Dorea sp. TaxID=2040332 RepID=UPI00399A53F1
MNRFEYLERKIVKVAQDFSFTFDKVHYSMPRKYLRQNLKSGQAKEIYVYNKHGDYIRTHNRSYTPKDWVIIQPMPAEYKDYGY